MAPLMNFGVWKHERTTIVGIWKHERTRVDRFVSNRRIVSFEEDDLSFLTFKYLPS